MLAIYVHIPFCKTLCPYCDFVKQRTAAGNRDAFTAAVTREILGFAGPREACSVFFGGGTPSQLEPAQLAAVTGALRERFDFAPEAEWTLEANPDDVTDDAARGWLDAGINRVSLGVQSLDDQTLRYLGRRHNAAAARRACETVGRHFERWSLDLMFGAPPVERWDDTLRAVNEIDPPHVAAYGLTYEASTPFARRAHEALDDDAMLGLYQRMEAAFADYDHYEISNFAKVGQHSAHNLVYWRNEPYAGFGTGAYCFVDGVRARNHPGADDYLRAPGEKAEALRLSDHEVKLETVIQHLRLRTGLPRDYYAQRFGEPVEAEFGPALASLAARGLLADDGKVITPTREGFYLNNEIGLELVG
ncbi:MAG: radical SAM family heme chaperone HemW [Candidatus Hydrogenedens sp.]|nr:radical SAM family heme chaperone HemW [Candidatus Hydrogenedens sp.]